MRKFKFFLRPFKIFLFNILRFFKNKNIIFNYENFDIILNIFEYTQHEISKGNYEKEIVSFIKRNVESNDNLVDVGSNVGYFTLTMASIVTKGSVFSFEPYIKNQFLLKKNIKLNNFHNIKNYELALSNSDSEKNLIVNKLNQGGNLIDDGSKQFSSSQFFSVKVKTNRFDTLLPNQIINGIKIDVEGHEIKVLEGMINLLSLRPPNFIVLESRGRADQIYEFLINFDFKPLDLSLNKYSPFPNNKVQNTVYVHNSYNFK